MHINLQDSGGYWGSVGTNHNYRFLFPGTRTWIEIHQRQPRKNTLPREDLCWNRKGGWKFKGFHQYTKGGDF